MKNLPGQFKIGTVTGGNTASGPHVYQPTTGTCSAPSEQTRCGQRSTDPCEYDNFEATAFTQLPR